MKAMILCAGYGKRLQPLTLKCPKPLLKIGSETLLSNTLIFLQSYGIKEVVINLHYLGQQIIDYIKEKNFNLNITFIEERKIILDTGGGVLNAIKHFNNEIFLTINPDTIWNVDYLEKLKEMEKIFLSNKKVKCSMLVTDKINSFDKSFCGDFNLDKNKINKNDKNNLKYIFTGLQIIKPDIFSDFKERVFSMNKVWDTLIENGEIFGTESNINFLHVSTLNVYKDLLKKLNVK